jgi:CheY-like chemotaxis protein
MDNIELLQPMLESFSHEQGDVQVVAALSGEMALRHLSMYGPFDLVITDMSMPRMDGIQLLRIIRSGGTEAGMTGTSRNILVVLVTAFEEDKYIESLKAEGFDLIITKPIRVRELLESITLLLKN